MEKDCFFTTDSDWFRYRAAAVIIEDGCVLLASNETADYFYSVGGGVHLGENSYDAVKREVFEETGVNYEVDRLAFIHENFFEGDCSAIGKKCHEICFYYLMKPRGSKVINCCSVCNEGREFMNWIKIDELKNHKAYPSFFADELNNLTDEVKHIVTREY